MNAKARSIRNAFIHTVHIWNSLVGLHKLLIYKTVNLSVSTIEAL